MAKGHELWMGARAAWGPGYVQAGEKGTMLPCDVETLEALGIKECPCCGPFWMIDHDERYLGADRVYPHQVVLLSIVDQLGALVRGR